MADIAAGDVTYTILSEERSGGTRNKRKNLVQLAFGNNVLTYPTGGVPLTKGKLGCPTQVDRFVVVDQGANAKGYKFEFDRTNTKLLVLVSGAVVAHTHDIKVIGGAPTGIDEPLGVEGGDTLAKDAATDRTIAGSASATKGGVVAGGSASAAALAQHANATFVPNPATLIVEVEGF